MEKSRYVRVIEGRRSEEMIQLNISSPWGSEVPFEFRNEEISGGEKNGERKGVSSANCQRAKKRSINIIKKG